MSEEFDQSPETNYSPFWPLLVVLVALLVWFGYQDWAANTQRSVYAKQFEMIYPSVQDAQNVANRYSALMKDLIGTAQTNVPAADIVKAAIQAGLIHVQPKDTNSTANPAAPAATK